MTSASSLQKHFTHAAGATTWCECLALIEQTGTRWLLSIRYDLWNSDLHSHVNDEQRHTQLMAAAAREARLDLDKEELWQEQSTTAHCLRATENYLAALFKSVARTGTQSIKRERRHLVYYSILSFLIERRLVKIYPHLAMHGYSESLRSTAKTLILEERDHLSMVTEHLEGALNEAGASREALLAIEECLAKSWLDQLQLLMEVNYGENSAPVSGSRRTFSGVQTHTLAP